MRYFRVIEGDASGKPDCWEYYSGDYDLDEAVALFEENNHWVFILDCRRNVAEEISYEQYKTGLQYNRLYEFEHEQRYVSKKYNLFPTLALAKMFANMNHKSGYVRIGYPNIHNVYKINTDGNFIFAYHHHNLPGLE